MKSATLVLMLGMAFSVSAIAQSQQTPQDMARQVQDQVLKQQRMDSTGLSQLAQAVNRTEALVYDVARYQDLLDKLQLDKTQLKTWERVVRAHQRKLATMEGVFLSVDAVGTLDHIRREVSSVRKAIDILDGAGRVAPQGKQLAAVLASMQGVESALKSFYDTLSVYQQRDYEVHQVAMYDSVRAEITKAVASP